MQPSPRPSPASPPAQLTLHPLNGNSPARAAAPGPRSPVPGPWQPRFCSVSTALTAPGASLWRLLSHSTTSSSFARAGAGVSTPSFHRPNLILSRADPTFILLRSGSPRAAARPSHCGWRCYEGGARVSSRPPCGPPGRVPGARLLAQTGLCLYLRDPLRCRPRQPHPSHAPQRCARPRSLRTSPTLLV